MNLFSPSALLTGFTREKVPFMVCSQACIYLDFKSHYQVLLVDSFFALIGFSVCIQWTEKGNSVVHFLVVSRWCTEKQNDFNLTGFLILKSETFTIRLLGSLFANGIWQQDEQNLAL